MNIHEKILAITKDIGNVPMEDKKVNNQYRFVSHQAVTDALRPLLIKHKATSIPTVIKHQKEGNTTILTVEITLTNVEKINEYFTVRSVGYGVDNEDKGTGKAFSYAVKTAYLKLFNLSTGDEDNERYQVDQMSDLEKWKTENPASCQRLKSLIESDSLSIKDANELVRSNEYVTVDVVKAIEYLEKKYAANK